MLDSVKKSLYSYSLGLASLLLMGSGLGTLCAAHNEETSLEVTRDDDGYHCRAIRPDGVSIDVLCDDTGRKEHIDIRGPAGQYVRSIRYEYNGDKASALTEERPDGCSLRRELDEKGRVRRYFASDNSVNYNYQYDEKGRLTSVDDGQDSSERLYNSNGQLVEETLNNGLRLQFQYDQEGRRRVLILPDGSSVRYSYHKDQLADIERLAPNGTVQYRHSYQDFNDFGSPSQMLLIANAGTVKMEWGPDGRISKVATDGWTESVKQRHGQLGDLTSEVNTLDPLGELSSHYGYDEEQRLVSESGIVSRQYAYDSDDNRVLCNQHWTEVDDAMQLVSDSRGHRWEYDLMGNPTSLNRRGCQLKFSYDALNRLRSVTDRERLRWTYSYDALNRRMSKALYLKQDGEWQLQRSIRFLWDGNAEIGAVDDSGELFQLRVLGKGIGDDMGASVAVELHGVLYAPINDFRGNVRCMVHAETGEIHEFYRYTAYGERQVFDGSGRQIPVSAINNPWCFASKRLDPESGWVYFGNRYYQAEHGRWLTPDPLGVIESANRYVFTQNMPLDRIDPQGMFSVSRFFDQLGNKMWDAFVNLFAASGRMYGDLIDYFDHQPDLQESIENINNHLQGGAFFILTGQNFEETHTGHVGDGEICNNVRISYTNGILNTAGDCSRAAEAISNSHGRVNVHYLYKATKGYSWDILRTGLGKLGLVSHESQTLAGLWKDLIDDMGGVQGDGQIIHYAHSSGGTDTANALSLLNRSERRMIKVHTFGSPTIISPDDHTDAYNYVSVRDGVPIFGILTNFHDAIFVGSFWGIPLIDHLFEEGTYRDIWEAQGQEFVQTYGSL